MRSRVEMYAGIGDQREAVFIGDLDDIVSEAPVTRKAVPPVTMRSHAGEWERGACNAEGRSARNDAFPRGIVGTRRL